MKRIFKITQRFSIALAVAAVILPLSFVFAPRSPAFFSLADCEKVREVGVHESIEHLFTHCLISHPEIAFADGNDYGKHLDRDCLTPKEFRKILETLYQKNYALADIRETYEIQENGTARRKAFPFPEQKKPLILSFDDVVYARKNLGKGMSDKLILTDDGEIVAYTKNAEKSEHKEEFLPVLEDFIAEHPDFSVNHARGILFLTGFDGVLGYRTERTSPNRSEEIKQAKRVIAALKENGWLFGSHSYAHGHMKIYTNEQMRSDSEKWKNEVESLVGKTEIYAYPYGEWALGQNGEDERQKVLCEAGFKMFCGVGENPFYSKMPLREAANKILFQDRCPLDGISLRNGTLNRLFDCETIYDSRRPVPFPASV